MQKTKHNEFNKEHEQKHQEGEIRTIHINKTDCFLVLNSDMTVQLNVPISCPDDEIPENAKYIVGLAHLMNEENTMLVDLVTHKWNELVDIYKQMKEGR